MPTLTQVGYALGLLLLLPLGDLLERRRTIVIQFLAVAAASVLAALSSGISGLLAASLLIGAAATVAQQIVPFVAILAAPEKRGQAIGLVMSGLLTGILFSRTLAGFVATYFSWRAMFWVAAPIALLSALLMGLCLPQHRPAKKIRYGANCSPRSARCGCANRYCAAPALPRPCCLPRSPRSGRSWRCACNCPPSTWVRMWRACSASSVRSAWRWRRWPGRVADRRGPYLVIGVGAIVTMLAWLVFGLWNSIVGMVVGVVLLDFGVQIALVSHQHLIYGLHPEFKSRLNTVFMTSMFLGGSLGSIGAAAAWRHAGWLGVSVFGGALAAVALISQLRAHRLQLADPAKNRQAAAA